MQKLGFILTMIGVACADSECLLIPMAIISVGAVLMLISKAV